MPQVDVYDISGKIIDQMELNDAIFGVEVNEHCVYEAVKNHLANKRLGTQSAKTRAEVRGGGKKPWRQKGTGRARVGSSRNPVWIGGGVVFAPKPRDYSYKINKKTRRLAIKSVLSDKVKNGNLIILDKLEMDIPKTKEMAKILNVLGADKKALIVTDKNSPNVVRSGRNIEGVQVLFADIINTYDILNHEKLIMTRSAVERTQEVFE